MMEESAETVGASARVDIVYIAPSGWRLNESGYDVVIYETWKESRPE